jgi:capsular polysaccharide biosynthesis protein
LFRSQFRTDGELVRRYREFDDYQLDHEVFPAVDIHIPQRLLSEPPQGIDYRFGPSGYRGNRNSNYCVIPSPWRDVNNYCHWTLTELPFLVLAFESGADNLLLPPAMLWTRFPFQERWMQLLRKKYPGKHLLNVRKHDYPGDALFPVNHDTSSSQEPIGKCEYRHYHHGKATPYWIAKVAELIPEFTETTGAAAGIDRVYISRKSRTLTNEAEVQELVQQYGFQVVQLEQLSLDDQVVLFAQARAIMGFHGAGLANILYCQAQPKIFEIVDRDCVHPSYLDGVVIPAQKATRTYYHTLSAMKQLSYVALESDNYTLDLAQLEHSLQAAGL